MLSITVLIENKLTVKLLLLCLKKEIKNIGLSITSEK